MKPLVLPWKGRLVPHVILDVNRACNISCAACYTRKEFQKSPSQVIADLEAALARRKLHTVTVSGGEPTLHPELPQILAEIHRRGLRTILLTNGLTLDAAYLETLKQTGLDAILLHVDRGQQRGDLAENPSACDVDRLRRTLVEKVAAAGIQVGLLATVYGDYIDDVERLVEFVHRSPHAHFLLATTRWDASAFERVTGNLTDGFFAAAGQDGASAAQVDEVTLDRVQQILRSRGMRPFGFLGSTASRQERRWVCYTSAVVTAGARRRAQLSLASALSDRLLLKLVRILTGKYVYHVRQNPLRFRVQILLNALSGGRALGGFALLAASCLPGTSLREKRIVFQRGPTVGPGGRIDHCRHCPDATVVNGKLVPICISDGLED